MIADKEHTGIDNGTSEALRVLCEEDTGARDFFEWAADRQNDAAQTSIDRLSQKAGVDRRKAIELAKQLERLDCGTFVVGRRGAPSRIEWKVSLKSMGQAATGQAASLESVDPELVAESADLAELKKEDAAVAGTEALSLPMQKSVWPRLSASLLKR
jgi:hypothetical protein